MRGRAAKTALMALVLVCLGLSGCGPDDDADSPEPQPEVSAAGSGGRSFDRSADADSSPLRFQTADQRTFPESPVLSARAEGEVIATLTPTSVVGRTGKKLTKAYTLGAETGERFSDLQLDEAGAVTTVVGHQRRGNGQYAVIVHQVDTATGNHIAGGASEAFTSSGGAPLVVLGSAPVGDIALVEVLLPDSGEHQTIAIDLTSGQQLWRLAPAQLVAAEGDTAVVVSGTQDAPGGVQGIDLETGDTRWSVLSGTRIAGGVGSYQGTVTIARTSEQGGASLIGLSIENGSAVGAPTSTDRLVWLCHPGDGRVAVCSFGDRGVAGVDLDTREVRWTKLPTQGRPAPQVSLVQGGRVYGSAGYGLAVVLDAATGRVVTPDAKAAPVATNEYGGVVVFAGAAVYFSAAG